MTVPQQGLSATDRVPNEIIIGLESATLRVPFEEARRYSRANQRIAEKDLPALVAAYNEKAGEDGGIEQRFQDRLAALRERVILNHQKEQEYIRKLKIRYEYLERLLNDNDNIQYQEWINTRLKRLVVEYFMDKGELEFAQSLIAELQLVDWIDIEVYSDRDKIIREMTDSRSFQHALQWCSENKPSLKKGRSLLEFSLRRQEMIEIARRGNVTDALAYGRRHLYSWLVDENAEEELWRMAESAMALIVTCDGRMVDEAHNATVALFKKEFNQLYNISDPPLLIAIIRAGLTLLKTPNCGDPEYYNINCPACQPELAAMATDLPFAHHDNSILVCRITGERMDDDNPPMVLPNGNVYSLHGLKKLVGEGASRIKCPRSGSEFGWEEIRKVYIT